MEVNLFKFTIALTVFSIPHIVNPLRCKGFVVEEMNYALQKTFAVKLQWCVTKPHYTMAVALTHWKTCNKSMRTVKTTKTIRKTFFNIQFHQPNTLHFKTRLTINGK